MSDDESRRVAGSVDKIPTTADRVSTDATALETQGCADICSPMGEDHIEATAPPEELTARSAVTGTPAATPAAPLPTLASAPSEEVGIEASADRSDGPALRARRIRSRVRQGPAAVDRAQAHCKRDCVRLGGGE